MSVVNRQMIGEAANNEVLRMQKCYFLMANGNMEVDRAMKEILIAEEEVKCFAKMGAELKIMAFDGVLRMTEELAKIETLVRKIIREGGEE